MNQKNNKIKLCLGNDDTKLSDWDKEAEKYEDLRGKDPVYRSCIGQVERKSPKKKNLCLDAGCGTGMSTLGMVDRAKKVVAVDSSFESLKILKSKGDPNILLVQADISALPFIDSAFDFCSCVNTLQHFQPGFPQEKIISEFRRVTKNSCKILVSVHHFSNQKRRAGWIKEGNPGQVGVNYIFRFERNDLLKIMPDASVSAVGYYGFDNIWFFGGRLQNLIAGLLGRLAAVLGNGHMLIGVEKNKKTLL